MERNIAVILVLLTLSSGLNLTLKSSEDRLLADYNMAVQAIQVFEKSKEQIGFLGKKPKSAKQYEKTIPFDESNSALLLLSENNQVISAKIEFTFDGKNPKLEYVRIIAFMDYLEQLNINDYTISSFVVDDATQTTVISCINGEMQPIELMSKKYISIIEDGSLSTITALFNEEGAKIAEFFRKNG